MMMIILLVRVIMMMIILSVGVILMMIILSVGVILMMIILSVGVILMMIILSVRVMMMIIIYPHLLPLALLHLLFCCCRVRLSVASLHCGQIGLFCAVDLTSVLTVSCL